MLVQNIDLVIRSTFDKMLEKNPAFDFGVLMLTLQLNFIATRWFGDQDHIYPKFGENAGIRLLGFVVKFAMKMESKRSIW
jgi:hypothetical protein